MKNHLEILTVSVIAVLLTASVASGYVYGFDPAKAAPAGDNYMYMELAQDPTLIPSGVYAGKYEYFFDMYTLANGAGSTFYFLHLVGLDNSKIANAETNRPAADYGPGGETTVNTQRWGDPNGAYEAWPAATGRVMDLWSKGSNATVSDATNFDRWRTSYDDGSGGWTDSGLGYAGSSTDNPHAYGEYVNFSGHPAMEIWKAELTGAPPQPVHWWNTQFGVVPTQDTIYIAGSTVWSTTPTAGLTFTLRVVYDDIIDPATIGWSGDATIDNTILGDFDVFAVPLPGDFDDDGDIDSDDIGLLCANLTGPGNPAGDPKYDLDGDGDADQADMDMLIHDLVEITGGDGTGTEYGDFDLDGDIDTTDLTILATNYGVGTTWAQGNANCDLVIDTTDLTIMATNFGFVASGAVPEPATLFVMGCGAVGLLRRRRRA